MRRILSNKDLRRLINKQKKEGRKTDFLSAAITGSTVVVMIGVVWILMSILIERIVELMK